MTQPRALVALALAAASCVGSIGPRASGDEAAPGRPSESSGGGAGAGPRAPGSADAATGSTCAAGPRAVAWRSVPLTREHYINTTSDLLGFDVRPLVQFSDLGGRKYTPGVALGALELEQRLYTAEAIAARAVAVENLPHLVSCDPSAADSAGCADRFVADIGRRAFRRPPTPEAKASLRRLFEAGKAARGFATGVEWVVTGLLQSPDFLYQIAPPPLGAQPGAEVALDDHALASRLSFFLWNAGPDAELLAAADQGSLATAAGVAAAVRRLVADPRSGRMLDDYYTHWLKLDELDKIARDASELTPDVARELRRAALQAIHDRYSGGAHVEDLFDRPDLFLEGPAAKLYAATAAERRGILTHPALMAVLANSDSSDPIRRGVFVAEQVLCQTLPEPLPDIPDLPPLRPGLSTRQRLEQHRKDPVCAGCHDIIDPPGLAFEIYDSIGRYRQTDQGVPVDSSGEVSQGLDVDGRFAHGLELFGRFGKSAAVRECLTRRWFEHALQRNIEAADACALGALEARFRSGGDLRDLVVSIAESEAFRHRLIAKE